MMKKYLILFALCFSTAFVFAQKKAVNKAQGILRVENPDVKAAREAFNGALTNPETKDDARTWYVAGQIESKVYDTEYKKPQSNKQPDLPVMYTALLEWFKYNLKAAELDQLPNEKGKVKPRYIRDIKTVFLDNRLYLFSGGAIFFENKDYQKAYESWTTYANIAAQPYMQKDLEKLPLDSNLIRARYYASMSATQLNNPELAISALTALKSFKNEELVGVGQMSDVYQLLAQQYEALKDTANLIKIYEEGTERFPDVPFFSQNLIAMYIYTDKMNEALVNLDKATQVNPTNAYMWTLKGSILDRMQKPDEALAAFEKAMEIDETNAEAVGNVGRILFNKAVLLNDEVNTIQDNKKYMEQKKTIVIPAFKKALPYLEKAHSLKPDSKDWMVALRGAYYNLDMANELKAIEEKLGQ